MIVVRFYVRCDGCNSTFEGPDRYVGRLTRQATRYAAKRAGWLRIKRRSAVYVDGNQHVPGDAGADYCPKCAKKPEAQARLVVPQPVDTF